MGAIYPDPNTDYLTPNFITPSGVEPSEPKPQTFGQKASDAFSLNNDVVNFYRRVNQEQFPYDPTHNPMEMLKGTHYWNNYPDAFLGTQSEADTRARMRRIDDEEAAKARSAESGPMGTALDLAAGVLSPTVFLPAGQILRSARGGYSAIKSAASIGVAGGVQSAAQEAILQGTQETRTLHESLINVGSGTLLAGILGAGASKLLQRFETRQAEAAVARSRLQVDAHNGVDILNTPPTEGFDVQPAARPGIEAFHGSPHDFEAFDISKIGIGEGAQAYGHGLYFAESEAVAQNYRDSILPAGATKAERSIRWMASNLKHEAGGDVDAALQLLKDRVGKVGSPEQERAIGEMLDGSRGRTYKVRIHADREHMLDWDKPLSEQSPQARDAMARLVGEANAEYDARVAARPGLRSSAMDAIRGEKKPIDEITGEVAIKILHRTYGQKKTSEKLHEAGIPGIKYLDQGSRVDPDMLQRLKDNIEIHKSEAEQFRGTDKGRFANDRLNLALTDLTNMERQAQNQTSNFVIFDDKLLTIIEKNGEKIDVRPFTPEAAPVAPSGATSSVGAAGTDTRQLEMFQAYPGMNTPGKSVSPTRTLLNSSSVETRKIAADLASTPYRFRENEAGVATSQGAPIDIQQRMAIDGTEYRMGAAMKEQYSDYFFGEQKRAPVLQSRYQRMTGASEKMSYDDFKQAVGDAWMNDGAHDIPQVTAAAKAIMAEIEHWAARADVSVEGFKRSKQAVGEAYFPHLWNKEQIKQQKPEFTNWLTGIYKADQETKRAAQERIGAYHGALESHQGNIDKLTGKIAKLNDDVEVVQARAEEATRVNKFANQRATTLREAVTTSALPEDNLLKAKGGAVFETKVRNRGNELQDRVSGKMAAIDDLEQKLAKEIVSHDEMRAKIEAEIGTWEGSSSTEAKSAMKARQQAESDRIARATAKGEEPPTKRLTSADDAIDSAVKRIMESDRTRTDAELRSRAAETTDRIIGSPDGRLPYDEHMGGPQIGKTQAVPNRGALANRRLEVTNAQAAPWIERDAEHVLASYLRTVVPDTLLSERFGDPEMTVAFKTINEDFNRLIDPTKPGKARDALTKERDNAIKVMAAIRDRLRGVYGWSDNTSQMARVAQSVKVLNNISDLGSSAIASLSDFAGPLFRWGITGAIRDGWAPFFQALSTKGEEGKQFIGQMRAIGIGIDVATNARQHSMDEITGAYKPSSPFERTLQTVNDKFFIANGLAPLTDMQKMISAHAAVHEIVNVSRRVSEGKATKREIGNMAEAGIDGHMAERIWREFNKPGAGEIVGKVYLPNTATWTDKGAAEAFNGAVYREVNIAVVTPGQDKPLFLSRPVGSLLGQFKTFTAAANERILIANLQRRDAQSLSGVVAAIGLGMLSYKINSLTGGQPVSDKPADWFREGVSRSGMLGWLEEGNAALAKATGGKMDAYRLAGSDKPLTRYAGRNTLDMVLGPTVGKARDLLSVPGPLFRGDWSASDTHQVRRLMPFENMFYLRGLFNKVEETTNSHFNIPERRDQTLH